jgi:transketolase
VTQAQFETAALPLAEWAPEHAPFADAIVALGRARDDVVVLSADLSKYTDILPFANAFPNRFIQVGMAEANMMGIAGGMAKRGLLPVAVTYGVFATRRAYDQVAMALSTGASRGIVVAFLPGITTPFRATHQANDDLALMRAVPNLTVVDPADAAEVRWSLEEAAQGSGTYYIRGLRGEVDRLFAGTSPGLAVPRVVRHGDGPRVISTGLGTKWALEAAAVGLEAYDLDLSILHVPTLKPLDEDAIISFVSGCKKAWTLENHSIVGGLGAAVSEALSATVDSKQQLVRLGVPDAWAPAGTLGYIRAQLGLDAESLAQEFQRGHA